MRRKSRKKAARKTSKKKMCVCKKPQRLENMMLSTLKTKKNAIEKAIAKKAGKLGVVKRTKKTPAAPAYSAGEDWSNI